MGDSPWDLDEKLLNFFTGKEMRGGFYVEAGAVNGVMQSNTLLLEEKLGWTGLLIEPEPHLYEQCVVHRPGNMVYNAALVDNDYGMPAVMGSFIPASSPGLNPGGTSGPGEEVWVVSNGREHTKWQYELALQGMISYKNSSFNIKAGAELRQVPAATLAYILKTLKIKKPIDLLSLDVEGLELPALGGLDLNINRPRHIIIETTSCEEKREKIYNYLVKFNYRFIEQMTPNDAFYIATGGKQK